MKSIPQFITEHITAFVVAGFWLVVVIVLGCALAMSRESDPEMTSERDGKEK